MLTDCSLRHTRLRSAPDARQTKSSCTGGSTAICTSGKPRAFGFAFLMGSIPMGPIVTWLFAGLDYRIARAAAAIAPVLNAGKAFIPTAIAMHGGGLAIGLGAGLAVVAGSLLRARGASSAAGRGRHRVRRPSRPCPTGRGHLRGDLADGGDNEQLRGRGFAGGERIHVRLALVLPRRQRRAVRPAISVVVSGGIAPVPHVWRRDGAAMRGRRRSRKRSVVRLQGEAVKSL